MAICKYCSSYFIPKTTAANHCSQKCYRMLWQLNLKNNHPEKHRRRLDRQNIRRKHQTRKRRGLPLNYPKLTEAGKGFKVKDGYIFLIKKDHPNAAKDGYIAEHVFVMSNHIGRPLHKKETVHHKNGIRNDNRIENLELWSNSHPYGQRVEDKINWCKEFLGNYGFDIVKKIV